jgi:hypothetical protein
MSTNAIAVADLVRSELARVTDPTVVTLLAKYGVTPRMELRPWNYAERELPCWIVFEHPASNTAVAYCEEGFGPKKPWGLLWLSGEHLFMGDDSRWFVTLLDAVRDTWAYADG